jgi:hypothetical protein
VSIYSSCSIRFRPFWPITYNTWQFNWKQHKSVVKWQMPEIMVCVLLANHCVHFCFSVTVYLCQKFCISLYLCIAMVYWEKKDILNQYFAKDKILKQQSD